MLVLRTNGAFEGARYRLGERGAAIRLCHNISLSDYIFDAEFRVRQRKSARDLK